MLPEIPSLSDRVRQGLNLFFVFAQIAAFTFSDFFHPSTSLFHYVHAYSTPLVPLDFTFGIWALVFLELITYGVYQASPRKANRQLHEQIGWYTASALIITTLWGLAAQFLPTLSLNLFFSTAILLLYNKALVLLITNRNFLSRSQLAFVYAPINLATGWIAMTTLITLSIFLQHGPLHNFGLAPTHVSCALIILTVFFLQLFLRFNRGNLFYSIPLILGFLGIALANIQREHNPAVAVFSVAAAIFLTIFSLKQKAKA